MNVIRIKEMKLETFEHFAFFCKNGFFLQKKDKNGVQDLVQKFLSDLHK